MNQSSVKSVSSHREILRSSSIIGGSSFLNILVSLVRTKVLAVLLGPSGVGQVGLLLTLMTTISSVAAMGLGTAGTRQLAEAAGGNDADKLTTVRRALFWATLILSMFGAVATWLLREFLAETVLTNKGLANEIGWLSLGVALTVAAGSQGAILNGVRRIEDMARLSILSGLMSTVLGLSSLWLWGVNGLIVFILAAPVSSFVIGYYFVLRLPKTDSIVPQLPVIIDQLRTLFRLGAAFMLTGLIWNVGHLIIRTLVQRELGASELGHFQAAWAISMTYMGFVLQAMGADYYPRLSSSMHDHLAAKTMVNEQTEVALLMAGPVVFAMLGLAPWIVGLLYTSEFAEAVSILRWQILGDILRVAAWPLSYVILASGDGRKYLIMESFAVFILVGGIWLGLPSLRLASTGIAFLLMYCAYLPFVYFLAKIQIGLKWSSRIFWLLSLLMVVGVMIISIAYIDARFGALFGLVASFLFGFYALARLSHVANLTGPVARLAIGYSRFFTINGWRRG